MKIEKTKIEGLLRIQPKVFRDLRGCFVETWQQQHYEAAGIALPFVQDNYSRSAKGTLRGLHYQKTHPQGKLVMVTSGEVFDVAVDLRKDSPTFGRWEGTVLSADKLNQLWIPPGLAHGFLVLSDEAAFQYKCTDFYHPEDEGVLRWNDPTLQIDWPIPSTPIVSPKDAGAPFFDEVFR